MNADLRFHLSPEIVKEGVILYWKNHAIRRRELVLTGFLLVTIVALSMVAGRWMWIIASALGVYTLSFWIIRVRGYFRILKIRLAHLKSMGGEATLLRLTEDKIILERATASTEIRWRDLSPQLLCSSRVLVLLSREGNFVILPREQIGTEAMKVIEERLTAANGKVIS